MENRSRQGRPKPAAHDQVGKGTRMQSRCLRRLTDPLEKDIQQAVVDHWGVFGLPHTLVAAIPNAGALGQPELTEGLADLVVLAPSLPVGFMEIKRNEQSPMSEEQIEFAQRCDDLGIPYALCVGRDEPIRVLEQWGVVRRRAA